MSSAQVDQQGTPTDSSAEVAQTRPTRSRRRPWRYRLGSVGVIVAAMLIWEALPRFGIVHEIILAPFTEVMVGFWELVTADFFPEHLFTTLNEILWGFVFGVLLGLVLGIMLAVWPVMKQLTYPLIVSFQAVPKVVFAPLFIVWFGYGQMSKIVLAIVIAFFPVLVNTMVGLENVPQDAIRLMRSLRATKLQIFRKVQILHAAPLIFAGIKTALTFAVIGAIVAEFLGASAGLGYLLTVYHFALRIDRVFAVIIMLSIIGAGLYFLIDWVDRKVIYWREEDATGL
jgi:NitT/TauT family transport system permease protein